MDKDDLDEKKSGTNTFECSVYVNYFEHETTLDTRKFFAQLWRNVPLIPSLQAVLNLATNLIPNSILASTVAPTLTLTPVPTPVPVSGVSPNLCPIRELWKARILGYDILYSNSDSYADPDASCSPA